MTTTDRGHNTEVLGYAAITMVLATWSFGPPLSARLTTHPLVSSFVRMTGAAALQWVLAIALRQRPSKQLLKAALLPGALFLLNNVLFFAAMQRASVANATLIVSLQPVFVLFLARPLFGERITRWDIGWTAVAVSFAAWAIVASAAGVSTRPTTPLGALLAFGSLLAFMVYFLMSKHLNSRPGVPPPHPIAFMTAIMTASGLASWPVVVLSGHADDVVAMSGKQLTDIFVLIVVTSAGHLFMTYAHRHVDASTSSLILLTQPVTSSLAAWWLLGQHIKAPQVIGGTVVIASVAMITIRRQRVARNVAAATVDVSAA